MTRPHGLVGKAYKALGYAALGILALAVCAGILFGSDGVAIVLGGLIVVGIVCGCIWFAYGSQSHHGGG